jgi:DNA-binding MarR family transcriptional regulator
MSAELDYGHLADTTISVAAHLEAELEEALAEHRLTRPSFLVLDALERADGQTLNQRELVSRVRRTSGTVSVRLGRLERVRMIEREPDPDNRRSVTVTLTERGRKLAQAARPAYQERAERLVAGLPDAPALAHGLDAWLAFFEPDERLAPRLGIAVASSAVANRMRTAVGLPQEPGVIVLRVAGGSAAETGGVLRGDLVTEAGSNPIRSIGDLDRAVRAADGALELKVLRGAEPRELQVTLD